MRVPTSLTGCHALVFSTFLGACCYKTHVRRQHKTFCTLLLFSLLMVFTGAGCSSHVTRADDPAEESVQTANAANDEEVVESGDNSTLEEDGESSSQKTTGFLMAIGYLATTIGMTILPLLMM